MSIETELINLTEATTSLLNAVNVQKTTLDNAVELATDAADRVESADSLQILNQVTAAANTATAAAAQAASLKHDFIGPTPPLNPNPGDIWVDSETFVRSVWYVNPNGTGGQWAELGPVVGYDPSAITNAITALSATDGSDKIGYSATATYSDGSIGKSLPKVNVKSYPFLAKGDGVTNDTAAIAAAVSYISSIGGGTIYFPAGTYVGYVVLENLSHVTLAGDGRSSIIYRDTMTAASHSVVVIKAKTGDIRDITIRDLHLKGASSTGGVDAMGIECNRDMNECLYTCYRLTVTRCTVDTTRSAGICLRGVYNAEVSSNYVTNTARDGIQVMGTALITNNRTYNTGDDGIGCHGYANVGNRIFQTEYRIMNNYIMNVKNGARGIAVAGTSNTIVSGNQVRGWGAGGIYILRASSFPEEKYPVSRIIISNNQIGPSQLSTSQGCIVLYGLTDQTNFPTDNFTDYTSRSLISNTGNEPMTHIKISGNQCIADEYTGKTVDGVAYLNPQYGIRFIGGSSYQQIDITNNDIYGMSVSAIQAELISANHYSLRKVRITGGSLLANNRGIQITGGAPSGGLWVNDVVIDGVDIDGTNTLGWTTISGIIANGIRKIAVTNCNFSNLNASYTASSTSAHLDGNKFENAPTFGTNAKTYNSGTNTWSVNQHYTSAWNADHLVMGAYHIWIDSSARLRIKSGAPTSDTDGTVIGTQT